MRDWRDDLKDLAGELGAQARRASRVVQRALDLGPYRLVGYRGYASADRALVLGRAFQSRGVERAAPDAPRWRNLLDAVKRVDTQPLPNARVRARLQSSARELVADDEGFLHHWLDAAAPLVGGWHDVSLELEHPTLAEPARAAAQVLVPDRAARFGVISDLDDTVLQSHMTSLVRAARMLLLENARTRLPFPGVAAFYRALERGTASGARNPIFYVSAGAWNLYDLVVEFLDAQRIPRGPTLLRDWDLASSILRTNEHKSAIIREILTTYPLLPFVLVGDSGQADPEIYASAVRDFPGRILAIYIRNVSPAPQRATAIQQLARAVAEAGSTLVLADDTLTVARHAASHGWIDESALEEIGGESREDAGGTPPSGGTLVVE